MAEMLKTTVYLPRPLKKRLAQLAKERKTSEAELIREAVELLTAPRPTLPLFSGEPILDWDEAMRGFGSD